MGCTSLTDDHASIAVRRSGDHIVLAGTRAQVTVCSRYTEDRLARATVATRPSRAG